jgi:type IV fimbrial biogenesis protein FimT
MTAMPRHARGFTLIEIMVALVVLSILLAVGIPTMQTWMTATRAVSAAEFYAEGMRMARAEALKRNVASRLTLTPNAGNGQEDWQVDICVPTTPTNCRDDTGPWSSTTTPLTATAGADNVSDFKSVFRNAKNLPSTTQMTVSREPAGADQVIFTTTGWVDGNVLSNLSAVVLAPAAGNAGAFPSTAVVLNLAGSVTKCSRETTISANDSRKCPP